MKKKGENFYDYHKKHQGKIMSFLRSDVIDLSRCRRYIREHKRSKKKATFFKSLFLP